MDIQTYENIQLNKAYIRLNIKYDGHFYYGSPILEKENKKKSKDKNPSFFIEKNYKAIMKKLLIRAFIRLQK